MVRVIALAKERARKHLIKKSFNQRDSLKASDTCLEPPRGSRQAH